MDRCTPILRELQKSCMPPPPGQARSAAAESAALQQLFQVVLQLNTLLRHAHENSIVLRDIAMANVVFAQLQVQRGWTLQEFTSATKAGKVSQHSQARRTPPEVRADKLQRWCTGDWLMSVNLQGTLYAIAVWSV
jgi:hypothetical protein